VPANRDREFVAELKFGEGTGSATPLAWSMAQFIRLAMNLKAGKNLDTPQVVYDRYVAPKGGRQEPDNFSTIPAAFQKGLSLDQFKRSFPKFDQVATNPVFIPCSAGTAGCTDTMHQMQACVKYISDGKTLQIAGDFTGWKPRAMKVKEQTCFVFAETARVEYKLIVDGKWITDPLNPNKIDNGVGGENSYFTMPDYKPTEWDKGSAISGKLESLDIPSKVFNDSRKVQVYVPQVQGNVQQSLKVANPIYPVMYVLDGSDYIKRAKAIEIQENLVEAGKVRPFIMVFLDSKDRNKEYWASDDYAKYLATEVVPAVDKRYRTYPYPEFRGVMGASLGGVTSVWTAIKYPDVFGRVGGQSSSFWIDDERVVKELGKLDFLKTKLKFYLDDGKLEGIADSEKAVEILRHKHYDVVYYESETGHNWTAWRDRLANAFIALFGNKILPR
jgi:enterochelin esterase family protein